MPFVHIRVSCSCIILRIEFIQSVLPPSSLSFSPPPCAPGTRAGARRHVKAQQSPPCRLPHLLEQETRGCAALLQVLLRMYIYPSVTLATTSSSGGDDGNYSNNSHSSSGAAATRADAAIHMAIQAGEISEAHVGEARRHTLQGTGALSSGPDLKAYPSLEKLAEPRLASVSKQVVSRYINAEQVDSHALFSLRAKDSICSSNSHFKVLIFAFSLSPLLPFACPFHSLGTGDAGKNTNGLLARRGGISDSRGAAHSRRLLGLFTGPGGHFFWHISCQNLLMCVMCRRPLGFCLFLVCFTQFEKHLPWIYPLLCVLIRCRSRAVRGLVSEIFSGPLTRTAHDEY